MKKLTNKKKLDLFKKHIYDNKEDISYKSFFNLKTSCNSILNSFLTTRKIELIYDLKLYVEFLCELSDIINSNGGSNEDSETMEVIIVYYIDWISSQSDFKIAPRVSK